jgi:Ca2+-binding EF-hand superfamily protein
MFSSTEGAVPFIFRTAQSSSHSSNILAAGVRSAFDQFDKNNDGVLERGEFRRGLFLLKAGLTAAHISELMQVR